MTQEPFVVMVTRHLPHDTPEAEGLLVDVQDDGAVTLVLDDGETVEIDSQQAVRVALAILSPLAFKEAA